MAGIRIPCMSMPFMFMPRMACPLGARRALRLLRTPRLAFNLAFRFDFPLAFGFDIFMPGMFCMS
ncbi:MAG: hypothetical protein M3444_08555 [Acidobacteriota bacterium]|nr:hypothetical protein [Acidobacteriota bacterium]